uniref:PHD-type domain-containing protein n=1 Tax=Psilocybe cubensis TaxID=181762 RepID=A0A8H8CR18_PSICU
MSTHNENTTPTPEDHSISEGLLPAFSAKQYSHLPTPQSPTSDPRYGYDRPHSPESPIANGLNATSSTAFQNRRQGNRAFSAVDDGGHPLRAQYGSSAALQQCATPESRSKEAASRKSINHSTSNMQMATPSSPPLDPPPAHSSALSSPFMAKLSIGEKDKASRGTVPPSSSSSSLPVHVDDVFASSQSSLQAATSTSAASTPPPISPVLGVAPNPNPNPTTTTAPTVTAGGEMERIRQSIIADRLAHIQQAEKYRPEYLKRSKRTLAEADPMYLLEDDGASERVLPVGIMESPHKGRRLKLFQETSEESFEESLMAGGYGRYRTADWVRQPQPISLPPSAVAGSSTSIVAILEEAQEAPPSEKELKKRKRLAAFRAEPTQGNSKLCAVELEGKGRVIIDGSAEEHVTPGSPEPVVHATGGKKKTPSRRKKKAAELAAANKKLDAGDAAASAGDVLSQVDKPNWPDSEFPWRLRTEERLEMAKAEEEERLHWIERFLDGDSDEEDEQEGALGVDGDHDGVARPGRGKMVPLTAYPHPTRKDEMIARYPTDPADARAALLAKRSVRALVYRQQRKQREMDDEDDDEVVCICNGRDDGRELVQCDACQMWYHLECIGIRSIAELGKEEDPWFCRRCVSRSRSPSTEPEVATGEPTFVPTDEEHTFRRSSDTPFFQPGPHDSPSWAAMKTPRTPPRQYGRDGGGLSDGHSSWLESSRPGPSTPQHSAASVRIYSSPYGGYMNSDDSPFDPTSTPSRGIKFNAPFTTPKSAWPARAIFQSPTRGSQRGSGNGFGQGYNNGNSSSSRTPLSDGTSHSNYPSSGSGAHGQDYYARQSYDESPVRRGHVYSSSASSVPTFQRRTLHSPPPSSSGPGHGRSRSQYAAGPSPGIGSYLEESPVMRSLGSRLNREPQAYAHDT